MTISFAWEGDQSVDYDFVPHVGTAPKRDAEFSAAFNSLYALARRVALRFFDRFLLDFGEADTAKALGLSTSRVKDAAHRARLKMQAPLRHGDEPAWMDLDAGAM